ncbi:hypothetical protein [Paenibacillus cremeus]|uniref:Uncharacterized protein n=1 Tax=Paenibacillus cremeus TaxID=2163881 RepID=A0A559KGZ1_9BACL|nr:hypothetical protein [Paenibacillus cremeus]TVY11348.1 hypothetical protein FPZ49_03720 [Paenibacillus cremeus]
MRIEAKGKGKSIEISLLDRVMWVQHFGEEEVESFIAFAYKALIKEECGDPKDVPKIVDFKLHGDICIELRMVTEYGCFFFSAAPYAIYGDSFPKPDDPSKKYHYSYYYMPHDAIKSFNKWLDKIEGPIQLEERRRRYALKLNQE